VKYRTIPDHFDRAENRTVRRLPLVREMERLFIHLYTSLFIRDSDRMNTENTQTTLDYTHEKQESEAKTAYRLNSI